MSPAAPELFMQNLLAAPSAVDQPGTHSEFVGREHGIKVNFDGIPDDSDLFRDWVDLVAEGVVDFCNDRDIDTSGPHSLARVMLLSVAGGTNRLVEPVANTVGCGLVPSLTHKTSPKSVALDPSAVDTVRRINPVLVIATEDIATRGTTSATAVTSARNAGAMLAEVLNTAQRRPVLEELEAIDARWRTITETVNLPTYTPDQCRQIGYCAMGWNLIEHVK